MTYNTKTFLIAGTLIAGLLAGCGTGTGTSGASDVSPVPSIDEVPVNAPATDETATTVIPDGVKGHKESMDSIDRLTMEYDGRVVNGLVANEDLIMEQHKIIEVADGWIRGENVTGSGEGIYYQEYYFADKGVTVEVGDVVEIYWEKADADEDNWEFIYTLKKL